MKKKGLLLFTGALLTLTAVTGCKKTSEKTLTSITVTPTMKTYTVGYQFTSADIGLFQANYSDGSTVSVKEGYTSDPTLPYTFVEGDVEKGKDFNFTYQGKSSSFHVGVKAQTAEKIEAALRDATKEYHPDDEITKSDIKVVATYPDKSTKEITDWTCSDFDSYGEHYFEAQGKKTFTISYDNKTTTLDVNVGEEITPYWSDYLQFNAFENESTGYFYLGVRKKESAQFPASKEIKIPRKVRGKNIADKEYAPSVKDDKLYEVTSIGYEAFSEADIEKVILPVSIREIETHAFGYSSLKEIKIPASVGSIAFESFTGCTNLTSVTFEDLTHEWFNLSDIKKWKPNADGTKNVATVKDAQLSIITLNASAASSTIAFGETTTITYEGQESEKAYFYSSDEEVVTVDENGVVTACDIEAEAYISVYTASGKQGFVPIKVVFEGPEYAKYVEFSIIEGTTNVSAKGKSGKYLSEVALEIPSEVDGEWVTGGTKGTKYTVTSIPSSGFNGWWKMKSIALSNTVTSIGDNAFYGCNNLESINIPDNITALGTMIFLNCGKLTSLTLPSNLQSIGTQCFKGTGIKSLTIPSSVTNIGPNVFGINAYDFKIESLIFEDAVTKWTISGTPSTEWTPSITASENVKKFKDSKDKTFTKQALPTIPKGLEFGGVVEGYTNKTYLSASGEATGSIEIPYAVDGKNISQGATEGKAYAVTKISVGCFEANESITEIKIPETMETIEDGAFESCENLATIIFDGDIACNIGEETGIFEYATTVKVKTGIEASEYITENFKTVTTEGDYTIYTKQEKQATFTLNDTWTSMEAKESKAFRILTTGKKVFKN